MERGKKGRKGWRNEGTEGGREEGRKEMCLFSSPFTVIASNPIARSFTCF